MSTFLPKLTLICDDDQAFRERLTRTFNQKNIQVCSASHVEQAIEVFKIHRPDSAVIDLKMPGNSGLVLLKRIKEIDTSVRVLVLTGFGSIATAIDSVRLGAHNYLTKPSSFQNIFSALTSDSAAINYMVSSPSLEEVEREYVQRVLEEKEGNISRTAKALGLHRRSLQRKLSKFSVS